MLVVTHCVGGHDVKSSIVALQQCAQHGNGGPHKEVKCVCITLSYEMTGDSHTMASTAGREEGTGGGGDEHYKE